MDGRIEQKRFLRFKKCHSVRTVRFHDQESENSKSEKTTRKVSSWSEPI